MARLIDADAIVTVKVFDEMTEEWYDEKMTIAEALDSWADEGCPEPIDAPTVGGWVSVKDRLPEENGIYLVCVALGYMDFYTWSDKIWFSSAFNVCDDGFVTHWMSLPEPPKEDDDDAE